MINNTQLPKLLNIYLFFTPEAGVEPHFAAQCVLARTMREQGHRAVMVRCTGIFTRCPVMDMYQLPYDADGATRRQICVNCMSSADNMLSAYGIESIDLEQALTHEMIETAGRIVDGWHGDLMRLVYNNVRFGEFCAHDVVLALKKYHFEIIDDETRLAWIAYIRNSILAHLLTERICAELPVDAIIHFNDYSLQLGARTAGTRRGIRTYSVSLAPHKSVDFRNFIITRDIWRQEFFRLVLSWNDWRDLAIDEATIREIAEDSIVRMAAHFSHTYSPAKGHGQNDILSVLGLSRQRKTIVAYTSSYDELIAGQNLVKSLGYPQPDITLTFPDQISWLKALSEYVEQSDDLQLIVRIHPREGANKRDTVVSQHLHRLTEEFGRPFAHCRFIWPDDKTSSYDLGEIAHLVTIGWSTIGLEMSRLGAPVLAINRGTTYPGDDFIEFAPTPAGYFRLFDKLLRYPVSIETVVRSYRYYNSFHLGCAHNLSDIISSSAVTYGFQGLPPYRIPREAEAIEQVLAGYEDSFNFNLNRLRAAQTSESVANELEYIKAALRILFHYLMTGEHADNEVKFSVGNNLADLAGDVPATVVLDNETVSYRTSDKKIYERYSPMCARIVRLAGMHHTSAKCEPPRVRPASDPMGQAFEKTQRLVTAGSFNDALNFYEEAMCLYPHLQAQVLLDVYNTIYSRLGDVDRYSLYVSRFFDFGIKPTDKVLDIGSGHLPFPFATHLADLALDDATVGRAGIPFKHVDGKPVYQCSVEELPFGDQEFDFIYCSHVLEHVASPEKACRELMRVGRRGYIETPTRGKDLWLNTAKASNHRWAVELLNGTLIFTEYTPEDIEGLNCSILLDMHCNPQTDRERALSALINLKSDKLNTMLYWEGSFNFEVRRLQPLSEQTSSPLKLSEASLSTARAVCQPAQGYRCVFLNTFYEGFMQALYRRQPHLAQAGYAVQHQAVQQALFGDSDFYSQGIAAAGWNADDLIVNVEPLQRAWGVENGFGGSGLAIAQAQLDKIRPDVLYIQDMHLIGAEFLAAVRPLVKLIVGQIASPFGSHIPITQYDIVITSFPHYVERFRQMGVTAYYQPLAFEPRVLGSVRSLPFAARPIDCSFVGGISGLHTVGTRLLESLVTTTPLRIWGYGAESLPEESALRQRHQGEVWGSDMFAVLASSRITVNRHVDVAENYANNMRLFEATGCGALLITDYKDNLHELFEIGTEVVAYRSAGECAELINYYLAHPAEAEAIAQAGQRRTLREHSYAQRMAKTAELLERHLRYRAEARMLRLPDRISDGHQQIECSEITSAMTSAWLSPEIPSRQRALVQHELAEMYRGIPGTPFRVLADILKPVAHNNLTILEIGCASGYYYEVLEYLLSKQLRYTGVDYSQPMIDMARQYYPQPSFFCSDGASLFFDDRQFEVVISSCVLLHVPNYRQHIFETTRVAQRYVVVSRTPICKRQATQYLKKFAYGIETVELVFNESELLKEFELNGFRLQQAVEYQADPLNDRFETTYLLVRA
jgi:ubiquinone/menaquinone biosynthesis C-methylase UbiE